MPHSNIVGGSTCGRLLACPGSYQATLALPPSADIPSEYAAEGIFAHEVMRDIMVWRQAAEKANAFGLAAEMVALKAIDRIGVEYHDRLLTREHFGALIDPALAALAELEQLHGGDFLVLDVEADVKFPAVPGAFGTVDLVLQSNTHIILVDWKFGQGVGVKAEYLIDNEDATDWGGLIVNPQLLFYATAHHHCNRKRYTRRKIIVAIIQPRGTQPLTYTQVHRGELKNFAEDVQRAVVTALERAPPLHKGEHCRFAPCKATCPLWTGPLLDLSAILPAKREAIIKRDQVTPYGDYLAKAKALVDLLAIFKKTLDEQLHAYLQEGGTVPGWRLKAKTKQRQWVSEETVEQTLRELGFAEHEIWQHKLQTFAVADAAAKRLRVAIPDELRVAPLSSETTVAPTDDPAPVIEPMVLMEQFAESLKQLRHEQT